MRSLNRFEYLVICSTISVMISVPTRAVRFDLLLTRSARCKIGTTTTIVGIPGTHGLGHQGNKAVLSGGRSFRVVCRCPRACKYKGKACARGTCCMGGAVWKKNGGPGPGTATSYGHRFFKTPPRLQGRLQGIGVRTQTGCT